MTTASPSTPDGTYRGQAFTSSEGPAEHLSLNRRIRNARRTVYGWTFRALYWTLPKLPLWLLSLIGRSTAQPVCKWMYRRRAEQHLAKVYGDQLSAEEHERILTGTFDAMRLLALECVDVIKKGPEPFLRRVDDATVRARLEAMERESPRGWIGITGHLGNWILLASWASSLPGRANCAAMAKRNPNHHLNAILDDVNRRLRLDAVYSDGPPVELVAKVIRLLRSGTRLGIVPDQDTPRVPGTFVDFLGHPAYTPTGPAQLALTANVPMVPIALVRKGSGFEVIGGEAIHPDRTRPRQEEILRLTRAWSGKIEEMVRQYPGQWSWIHRRWRTTPEKLAARGRAVVPA